MGLVAKFVFVKNRERAQAMVQIFAVLANTNLELLVSETYRRFAILLESALTVKTRVEPVAQGFVKGPPAIDLSIFHGWHPRHLW